MERGQGVILVNVDVQMEEYFPHQQQHGVMKRSIIWLDGVLSQQQIVLIAVMDVFIQVMMNLLILLIL
jgi:hypothetical protein